MIKKALGGLMSKEGPPQHEQQAPERQVMVDQDLLGMEVGTFALKDLEAGHGGDEFTELWLTTESGNMYLVFNPAYHPSTRQPRHLGRFDTDEPKPAEPKLAIMDARTNEGKGEKAEEIPLSDQDIERGTVRVGRSFHYGKRGITTRVSRILAVNGRRRYVQDSLRELTGGEESTIPQEFRDKITPRED